MQQRDRVNVPIKLKQEQKKENAAKVEHAHMIAPPQRNRKPRPLKQRQKNNTPHSKKTLVRELADQGFLYSKNRSARAWTETAAYRETLFG